MTTDQPRRPRPAAAARSPRSTPPASWASAVAVRGGRIVGRRVRRRDRADRIGPSTRVIELRGRTVTPGLPGRPRPPGPRRAGDAALRPARRRAVRTRRCDVIEAYVAAHPDEPWILGSGWYMAAFEGGTPRREDLDRDRRRTGRPSCRTATVTARGSTRGRSSSPGSRPRHARPGRRPDRARPRRDAERHAPRGRHGPRRPASCPTTRRPTSRRRSGSARRHLHELGITAWQDAIVEPEPRSARTSRWPSRGELTGRVVGRAVVGAPPRRRADRGVRRAPSRRRRSAATRRRA